MENNNKVKEKKWFVIVEDVMTYYYYTVLAEDKEDAHDQICQGKGNVFDTVSGDVEHEVCTVEEANANNYCDIDEADLTESDNIRAEQDK
mgnify:CR=1 FL=1